jgi:hypothetical protein
MGSSPTGYHWRKYSSDREFNKSVYWVTGGWTETEDAGRDGLPKAYVK